MAEKNTTTTWTSCDGLWIQSFHGFLALYYIEPTIYIYILYIYIPYTIPSIPTNGYKWVVQTVTRPSLNRPLIIGFATSLCFVPMGFPVLPWFSMALLSNVPGSETVADRAAAMRRFKFPLTRWVIPMGATPCQVVAWWVCLVKKCSKWIRTTLI